MNLEIIKECRTFRDVCKKLNLPKGGAGYRKAKKIISENNIDISHFDHGSSKRGIRITKKKNCPICNIEFEFITNVSKKEKETCSRSCANTYFRTGKKHPNWSDNAYRTTCFFNHEKKCVICEESNIVEVHHLDENKKNNNPENLIPLCPTHHQYWHSKFKYLVEKDIYKYIDNWKNKN